MKRVAFSILVMYWLTACALVINSSDVNIEGSEGSISKPLLRR